MTWPHDPSDALDREQERALKEGRGCGGCLYLGWGPRLLLRCRQPERSCLDASRLTHWVLGCEGRVPREGGQVHDGAPRPWPEPRDLAAWAERWAEERMAERVAALRPRMREAA